jgi:glycosyltransferase involved in cell wall biosynthesis
MSASLPAGPVAILSHAHPSVSKGGAEIAAHALFEGLRALGVPALFVAAVPRRLAADVVLLDPGERVLVYDEERYDHFFNLSTPALVSELVALLRAEGAGAVNFHHFLNFGLGALRAVKQELGLPSFLTLHEFLAMCAHHGQMVTRPARTLCERATPLRCLRCFPELGIERATARRDLMLEVLGEMDGFVAPSHFLAERFGEWGLPRARIAVIENGLAHGARPAAPRPAGGRTVFSVFGQLTPFKGVGTVLDAADEVALDPELAGRIEIRLHGLLVGQDEAFRARFEASLAAHPFLRFAGPYENETVRRLMAQSDYVVVPSTWWENSPVVIQESFSSGRPVICSGIGGMAEKVTPGESGLHFEPGDPRDLVRVLRLAAEPATRAALTRLPPTLDEKTMASRYLAFLGERLGERLAGPAPKARKRAANA